MKYEFPYDRTGAHTRQQIRRRRMALGAVVFVLVSVLAMGGAVFLSATG